MAVSLRNVGLYASVGFIVSALIISGIAIAGFNIPELKPPSFTSETGTLIIKIMDKPVELKHLNLTIDWVKINNQDDNWIDLEIMGGVPFYFDLLALQNVTETLSETLVPTGQYNTIKMHVLKANATYMDGSTKDLKVPGGIIKVALKTDLYVEASSSVTVLIDLQPDDLKSIAVSHSLNLRPVIRARVGG